MLIPRYYQQEAHHAAIAFLRTCNHPCLIEAATGAGKSVIIAMLADTLYKLSRGKSILCLAPTQKLVKQNREKFLTTGKPASIYSASAGSKCLKHPVVFATPVTVLNDIDKFKSAICAVVIDEAHSMPPTMVEIVDKLKERNSLLRVIGLTATPFVRNEGYIYNIDENGDPLPDDQAKNPYFTRLVYKITKKRLEEEGFLTPAKVMSINAEQYDLSALPRRQVDEEKLNTVYLGQGRATARICADFVSQTMDCKGVMVFAATVKHAEEIAASLPVSQTRIIGGAHNMTKKARETLEDDFAKIRFKYLISVGTMTTGVDFPHVDAVVIMRRTESLTLLEQIIGRGGRLYPGKTHFKLFDYADNLEHHYGEDLDLYNPVIYVSSDAEHEGYVPSLCPSCGTTNQFSARPNPDGLGYDSEGYFVDLAGTRVQTDQGPMPGHYGRRCRGLLRIAGCGFDNCSHRWTDKKCNDCGESNDISAKYCSGCRSELVDPNEKLIIEFRKRKKDPTSVQTDLVLHLNAIPSVTRAGEICLKVKVKTHWRTFEYYLFPNSEKKYLKALYEKYIHAGHIKTITYRKDSTSGFYSVHDYNQPEDRIDD